MAADMLSYTDAKYDQLSSSEQLLMLSLRSWQYSAQVRLTTAVWLCDTAVR